MNFKTLKIAKLAATVPLYPLIPSKRQYAAWMRREVERAGCLYVKIGQWVSSRTDVFPKEITEEFASLRTASDPMDLEDVRDALRGIDVDIEDAPLSTGSIAQVHRGTFEGRSVAVKIQRPKLLQRLTQDVSAIKAVLGWFRALNGKMIDDLTSSLDDLIDTVRRELDFDEEAAHMERFRRFFELRKVRVPRVYFSTPKVLVMEYLPSEPFSGSAARLMEAFFVQFFELGWLHTDMHAGNLGLANDELVLYDFGSVLEIPDDIRLCIKHLMVAYVNRNPSIMVDYMLEYGLLIGDPGPEERRMLEAFVETVLDYVEVTDSAAFASAMKSIPVYTSPTTVFRPEIFMIMRSFTLLEGLCKDIDDEFVIVEAVTPLTAYFATDPMVYRLKAEDDIRTWLKNL